MRKKLSDPREEKGAGVGDGGSALGISRVDKEEEGASALKKIVEPPPPALLSCCMVSIDLSLFNKVGAPLLVHPPSELSLAVVGVAGVAAGLKNMGNPAYDLFFGSSGFVK